MKLFNKKASTDNISKIDYNQATIVILPYWMAKFCINCLDINDKLNKRLINIKKQADLLDKAVSTPEGFKQIATALQIANQPQKIVKDISQGLDPDSDNKSVLEMELEAFDLKNAPIIKQTLPDGSIILRRQIPLYVSFKEMQA